MRFKDKLEKCTKEEIWNEYCGFLDLSMDDYMKIQFRLLKEQISLFGNCELGKHIMGESIPATYREFCEKVPLTTYEDYQGVLLEKREDMLPGKPVAWLKTTWESGFKPEKTAPYTREMLDVYTRNILAAMILSTSSKKGSFHIRSGAKVLYGLAPMPYATGLFPLLIDPEIDLHFMPSLKQAKTLSFSGQNKEGFAQAVKCGLDQFFGMSGVVYTITKKFDELINSKNKKSLKSIAGMHPSMLYRYLRAKYISSRDDRPIKPSDLFSLSGFVCVGTDTALYKHELEEAWGVRPLEIHGGTETSCLATETWNKDGLVFFPDNAFYEFIPKQEMLKNEEDPSYIPRTYLMDEVAAGEEYELVVTVFKGGAFMRYRPGDMYRCLRIGNEEDGLVLPQFEYIDRVPSVIDIAGFTRFTERSIDRVISLSGLPIARYIAAKEYGMDKRSFMHLYVEIDNAMPNAAFISEDIIVEQFGAYYRKFDHDYDDLKRLLGMEPTKATILPRGSIENYEKRREVTLRRVNPSAAEVKDLLNSLGKSFGRNGALYAE